MRAMVAATDALRACLEAERRTELAAADLTRPGTELADCVRHYQLALRHFVKDWLRNRRQMFWLVDASSGRTLAVDDDAPSGAALAADSEAVLAEDQSPNGLRPRLVRAGLGLPIACWTRSTTQDPFLDPARISAARPWTVLVDVTRHVDRRVRTVRAELLDPAETATLTVGGVQLPIAADFTAPVAITLGLDRKPAAVAYGVRGAARRGTVNGFSELTPFDLERAPLVLLESAGLATTAMAQIANEVAGDPELRQRFQVWLYRLPLATPLFVAASVFRADLARFVARFGTATGRAQTGRVAVVARGLAAVVAHSLLVDSASTVWDAIFTVPPARLNIARADRALLERLLCWRRAPHIECIVTLAEPENAAALTGGVGARAVQLLQQQAPEFRDALERIYGGVKQQLRAAGADAAENHPGLVVAAIAAAALAGERAFIARVMAADNDPAGPTGAGAGLRHGLGQLRQRR